MKIEIKKVKLSDIRMNPDNPRTISEKAMERLVKSLKEFPDMLNLREIVVDETMTVLGGNMRLLALQKIGAKDCTAKIVTGLTDDQKREFIIKDNSAFGEWDLDALANAWSDLPLADWGIDLPDEWLNTKTEDNRDSEPQIDRAEELNQKWDVKAGDLWLIGEHRLLCGDSTKKEDVERVMDGEKADMAVTSPPYGVGKSYENKGIGPWFDTIRPVIKNIVEWANVVVWQIVDLYSTGSQFIEPTLSYSISMFADNGMRPLWFRIWEKQGINYGVGAYHLVTNKPAQQYEYIATFGEDEDAVDETDYEFIAAFGNSKYKFTKRLSRQEKKAWGYAGVWKINTVKANDVHVAMYPLELPTRVIKMHSDVGGIILDPFLGSGTTMVACQNLNRKCRGIEISTNYCAVILERMITAFPEIDIRRAE